MLKNQKTGLVIAAAAALALAGAAPEEQQSRPTEKRTAKTNAPPPPLAGTDHESWKGVPIDPAAAKGLKWLIRVQGADGGWGQDGGESTTVKPESAGSDVANTSLACLAILRSGLAVKEGPYLQALNRGVEFVLRSVERIPVDGLAVTNLQGTQIQRKLGPHIDTFLSSLLLSELDDRIADKGGQKRVHVALGKVIAKIEKHQSSDGSWNEGGGWAPVIGTSLASRSLYIAQQKGNPVSLACFSRIEKWTNSNFDPKSRTFKVDQAAGVELYVAAQALDQANRGTGFNANFRKPVATGEGSSAPGETKPVPETPAPAPDLEKPTVPAAPAPAPAPAAQDNKALMREVATEKLAGAKFLEGFGSMGGEEFVSYQSISESLVRAGGQVWIGWNSRMKDRLVKLQNADGTWAGHHCITGRVACTSSAVMTLLAERGIPKP